MRSCVRVRRPARFAPRQIRLEDSATPAPKKAPATTQAVPQGVKIDDLDSGTRTIKLPADSLFKKKSNKINVVFMFVGLALAGVIVVLLILAVLK